MAPESNKEIVQNLQEAGCKPEMISLFLQMQKDGKAGDQRYLLASYRKTLLEKIHREQAKLDCLDYLIYQLRKGQVVNKR